MTRLRFYWPCATALFALSLTTHGAFADTPLTVWNPSFESPAFTDGGFHEGNSVASQGTYGWDPGSGFGIWNPQASFFPSAGGNNPVTGGDGAQIGYFHNQFGGFGVTQQRLVGSDGIAGNADDPLLTANTTYTLIVAIGHRLNDVWGGYDIQLLAGSTIIGEQKDTFIPADGGPLVDRTIVVNSNSFSGLFGQPLTILLSGTIGNSTTEFDNVRISALTVPEPCSAWLLLLGTPLLAARLRSRRKQNYLTHL
jgi:hypothetical protein